MHQRRCQIVADPAFFPPPDPPPPPSFPCTNTNERTLSKKKKQVERSPKKKKFARVDEDELTQLRLKKSFWGGEIRKRWMDQSRRWKQRTNASPLYFFFFFFFFFRAILPLKFIFIFFTSNKNPFRHEGWKKIWAADFVLEKSNRRTLFSKHGQTVGQPIVDFSEALTYSPMPYRGFPLPSFIFFFAIPPTSCGFILPGPPWIWRLIRLYWTVSTGRAPPSKLMGFPLVPSFPFLCVYIPTFLPSFLPSPVRSLFFSTIGQNLS